MNAQLNGVIVYLSRRKDIKDLRKSLVLLYKNFNNKYHYPVIIFNDNFTIEDERIIQKINALIKFVRLKFEIPSWIDQSKPFKTKYSVGYRHMCRFFSGELYKLDIMKDYNWYWRLDSDSFIYSQIKYDVFKFMEENGYVYGYLGRILKDDENFVVGLWDLIKEYIQKNNIKPKFLYNYLDNNGSWVNSMFYTNFEVSRLDFWKSDEYMRFYNYIDKNGGIYYNRWGDNVIHWLALSILLDKDKVHCFKDIDYAHGYFRPNQYYRLYSLVKKYKINKLLEIYLLYIIKNSKTYDFLNRHLIYKLVDILNKYLNYKRIQDDVYCISYA